MAMEPAPSSVRTRRPVCNPPPLGECVPPTLSSIALKRWQLRAVESPAVASILLLAGRPPDAGSSFGRPVTIIAKGITESNASPLGLARNSRPLGCVGNHAPRTTCDASGL